MFDDHFTNFGRPHAAYHGNFEPPGKERIPIEPGREITMETVIPYCPPTHDTLFSQEKVSPVIY